MSDRIELRGLRLMVRCGALPEERQRAQPFELDLDIHLDLAGPGASDELVEGRLVRPFSLRLPLAFAYYLVYPAEWRDLPKIRAFREWIAEEIGPDSAIAE